MLYPAVAVDRHWTLLGTNRTITRSPGLVRNATPLRSPVNVLTPSLAPESFFPADGARPRRCTR